MPEPGCICPTLALPAIAPSFGMFRRPELVTAAAMDRALCGAGFAEIDERAVSEIDDALFKNPVLRPQRVWQKLDVLAPALGKDDGIEHALIAMALVDLRGLRTIFSFVVGACPRGEDLPIRRSHGD